MSNHEQDLVRRSRRFYLSHPLPDDDGGLVNLSVIMTEWHPTYQQGCAYQHHSEWVWPHEVPERVEELLQMVQALNEDLAQQHALF